MSLLVQYIIPIIYTSGLVTIILFCAICPVFLLCFYYFLVFWVGRRIKTFRLEVQRRLWHSTPVLVPGKSHGWRSLLAAVHGVTKSWTWLSDFTFTFHFHALEKEMATHSSVLAWRIPGTGEPGGLPSMGVHRVGHDWSDLAAAACPG